MFDRVSVSKIFPVIFGEEETNQFIEERVKGNEKWQLGLGNVLYQSSQFAMEEKMNWLEGGRESSWNPTRWLRWSNKVFGALICERSMERGRDWEIERDKKEICDLRLYLRAIDRWRESGRVFPSASSLFVSLTLLSLTSEEREGETSRLHVMGSFPRWINAFSSQPLFYSLLIRRICNDGIGNFSPQPWSSWSKST